MRRNGPEDHHKNKLRKPRKDDVMTSQTDILKICKKSVTGRLADKRTKPFGKAASRQEEKIGIMIYKVNIEKNHLIHT